MPLLPLTSIILPGRWAAGLDRDIVEELKADWPNVHPARLKRDNSAVDAEAAEHLRHLYAAAQEQHLDRLPVTYVNGGGRPTNEEASLKKAGVPARRIAWIMSVQDEAERKAEVERALEDVSKTVVVVARDLPAWVTDSDFVQDWKLAHKGLGDVIMHLRSALARLKRMVGDMNSAQMALAVSPVEVRDKLEMLIDGVSALPPGEACPWCKHLPQLMDACPGCRGRGYVNTAHYKTAPDELKDEPASVYVEGKLMKREDVR